MNEKQVQQDTEKVKKDLNTLLTDRVAMVTEKIEKLTNDAKESVASATDSILKDVEIRLGEYNSRAAEIVDKVPGGFVEKTTRYPWVAMSFAVIFGFFLGTLLKPSRQ